MADPHVLSALICKRAEISGYIRDLESKARAWRSRLVHIDASIRLFAPDLDPGAIPSKRTYKSSAYFTRGEFVNLFMAQIRGAQPKAATSIAAGILTAKQLPADDPQLRAAIASRVGDHLRKLERRGMAIKFGKTKDAKWQLCAPREG
jgi:hypothetical protein